jgi:hypothetical protein
LLSTAKANTAINKMPGIETTKDRKFKYDILRFSKFKTLIRSRSAPFGTGSQQTAESSEIG